MRISIRRTPSVSVHWLLVLAFAFAAASVSGAAEAQNRPPKISGNPATTVTVGKAYSFRPTVRDPDTPRNRLRFSITNKPGWAQFSTTNGTLQGTPRSAGRWTNIRIAVTDGRTRVSLPAFTITARNSGSGSGGSNGAPTISGSPPKSVVAGSAYSFTPKASDPNGDRLTFSIQNRPAWASFSTSTGRLSGTPTRAQVGTYSNIVIRVSDGRSTVSLPAFSIAVTDVGNGSATLSWTAPTRNSDGSTLRNLAGYRILYGTSSSSLNRSIDVNNPGLTRYVVENLSPATYYFAVVAYTSSGAESERSAVKSKTIR